MAGNNSKPLQLVKGHRTKEEIEHRKKAEAAMRTNTEFKATAAVRSDPVARKEFNRLKKLYKDMGSDFVDGLDEQMVNRYCLLISREKKLLESEDYGTLHKTQELILKLEDRLFLSPAARIKAIPKKPIEEKKKSKMAEFLERRGQHGT
jgi:hypothetical protein